MEGRSWCAGGGGLGTDERSSGGSTGCWGGQGGGLFGVLVGVSVILVLTMSFMIWSAIDCRSLSCARIAEMERKELDERVGDIICLSFLGQENICIGVGATVKETMT